MDFEALGRILHTAIDGYSGKKLGSIKEPDLLSSLLPFGGNANSICSGPVKYGNQALMTTQIYWVAGEPVRNGHLFSVTAPERKP